MLCPLLTVMEVKVKRGEFPEDSYCLQEKCAWWDKGWGRCALVSMLEELKELGAAQDNLAREINQAVVRK